MLVLDTDVFSLTVRENSPEGVRVRERIRADGRPDATTVVTVEEQLKGRVAACHRAVNPDEYITASELLRTTLADIRTIRVLPFTALAADQFRRLKAAKVRIGTRDLRIAAIVRSLDATLITRNLSDFRQVPGLKLEDWTRPV